MFGSDGGDTIINDLCYDGMYQYLAVGSSEAPSIISASWSGISSHSSLLAGTTKVPIGIEFDYMDYYNINNVYTTQVDGANIGEAAANQLHHVEYNACAPIGSSEAWVAVSFSPFELHVFKYSAGT